MGSLSTLPKWEFVNFIISFFHYFWCQNWNQWHKMSGKNTHLHFFYFWFKNKQTNSTILIGRFVINYYSNQLFSDERPKIADESWNFSAFKRARTSSRAHIFRTNFSNLMTSMSYLRKLRARTPERAFSGNKALVSADIHWFEPYLRQSSAKIVAKPKNNTLYGETVCFYLSALLSQQWLLRETKFIVHLHLYGLIPSENPPKN